MKRKEKRTLSKTCRFALQRNAVRCGAYNNSGPVFWTQCRIQCTKAKCTCVIADNGTSRQAMHTSQLALLSTRWPAWLIRSFTCHIVQVNLRTTKPQGSALIRNYTTFRAPNWFTRSTSLLWRFSSVINYSFRFNPLECIGNYSCIRVIWSWYTGRWWVGCHIWYSEEGTGRGRSPPDPSSLYQMQQPTHQRLVYQSRYCCVMVSCCAVFIARQHTDTWYSYSNSVCPSVRPSVTFRY